MSGDDTKELLESLLAELYSETASSDHSGLVSNTDSYLIAGDGQYLGRITDNKFDQSSILNEYGPFGSKYSPTSIFNKYCPYGGPYGQWSPENLYCNDPPKLIISGRLIGRVSQNRFVANRIPFESFLYALKHNIGSLLRGQVIASESEARKASQESFLEAADGTFLGTLTLSSVDTESVFNKLGPYGSKLSAISIFNNFSPYGGQFSPMSPFNQLSQTPPKIYIRGKHVGFLTTNRTIKNRVDPRQLREWVQRNIGGL